MQRLLIVCVLLLGSLAALAQEPEAQRTSKRKHYSPLSLGWSHHTALDQGMSPLIYSGSAMAFSTGYFTRSEKTLYSILLDIHGGRFGTRASNEGLTNRAWLVRSELGFNYLRKVKEATDGNVRWYAGGHITNPLNFRINIRLGNSAANYDFFSSLGFSGRLERDFEWKERTLIASWSLRLPLFSYSLRPNYSGAFDINDQAEIQQDVFDNREWVSMNKFFRFNSQLMLTYPIKNGNLLQLGYEWDFYTLRTTHQVNAAMHSIVFSRTFQW